LYEIGEIPPLGHVPPTCMPGRSRRERHGEPEVAMQQEVVPVWEIGDDEVLVFVMAAGVNYNAYGPVSASRFHRSTVIKNDYVVNGSDASGHRLGGRLGR
jgi:crotonyl-CoA carboxylase/reductase